LTFFVSQPGTVWIDDVSMRMGQPAVYRRDFEHGIVLLNYNPTAVTVPLDGTYKRLDVPGSSVWNGGYITSELLPPSDARILMRTTGRDADDPSHGWLKASRPVTRLQSESNPFRIGDGIRYQLDQDAEVTLSVYDVAGRLVRTLVQGRMPAGTEQSAQWDGKDTRGARVPAGVYFARLETPGAALTEKLTVLR
jgi:hypothetical protein